jgi:ADP-ribose pyrophosphatase YjhB (NUDIX family)
MQFRFNPSARAVVIRDGHVLLQRAEQDSFWALPGGRIELGEEARQTIVREMDEELGERAQAGRLLWIVENFFKIGDQGQHEIGFFHEAEIPGLEVGPDFRGREPHLLFRWFPLTDVARHDIRPAFLKDTLAALPSGIEHRCWRDDSLA